MRKTYVILGIVVVLLIVALGAVYAMPSISKSLRETSRVTDPKQTSKLVLGLVQPPYEDDYQVTRVPGYVDNLSGSDLAKVQIEIQLTDSNGNRKELVKYTLEDVAPRSRKTFDVSAGTVEGSRSATMKIVSVDVVR